MTGVRRFSSRARIELALAEFGFERSILGERGCLVGERTEKVGGEN